MVRSLLPLAIVLVGAAPALAQPCRGCQQVQYRTVYPQVADVTTVTTVTTVVDAPIALFTVPTNPTVLLNIYPCQSTRVLVPAGATVTLNGQRLDLSRGRLDFQIDRNGGATQLPSPPQVMQPPPPPGVQLPAPKPKLDPKTGQPLPAPPEIDPKIGKPIQLPAPVPVPEPSVAPPPK